MTHFYETIRGWFTFPNLYSDMVKRFPSGSRFLEVGTFAGQSFAFLAVEIVNSGKEIKLFGIDGFGWSGLMEEFMANMKPLNGDYTIIKGNSVELSETFVDHSFDFIFIDANHTYEEVKKDIEAYLPKVKKGGVLAGHDYHPIWSGVIKSVDELFGDKIITNEQESTWMVNV